MQDVVVPIDFGQGIDTKTDPKLVMPGKFQLIKDGIFTKAKQVTKRNGYDQITATAIPSPYLGVTSSVISNPKLVASYRNELVAAALDGQGYNRLFSYSEALLGWADLGPYSSIKVEKDIINADFFTSQSSSSTPSYSANPSCAVSGNIACYTFESTGGAWGFLNASSGLTYATIVDLETGQHLVDAISVGFQFSKCVVLSANKFGVFSVSYNGSIATLVATTLTVSLGGGVVTGPTIPIGNIKAKLSLASQFPVCYDVVSTSTGCIVSVANEPNIDLYSLDTSLSTLNTASIISSGVITSLTSLLDASGRIWVYWITGSSLKYSIYSSTLVLVLAQTTLNSSALSNVSQLSAVNGITGTQRIFFSVYSVYSVGSDTYQFKIQEFYALDSGSSAGSPFFVANELEIYSKPFQMGGTQFVYLPCVAVSQSQSQGIVLQIDNRTELGNICSKFLTTSAEGIYEAGFTDGSTITPPKFIGTRFPGFMNVVYSLTSTKVLFGAGFIISLNQTVNSFTGNLASFPLESTTAVNLGTCGITLDFDNKDAYQSVIQQDTLVLNGGIVSMYDSGYVSEVGFTVPPDNISIDCISSGGSISSGTYIYYVTWFWTDSLGNDYESAPSPPVVAVFSSGSSNSVKLGLPVLAPTNKRNISLRVYRSDSSLGGNEAFLVANIAAPTAIDTTIIDTTATGSKPNVTLYTQNGAVLDNLAPPPSMILWTNNNRIWCIDSENEETTIEYSKTASSGTGINFSTGSLDLIIDSKDGPITGASPMDEKTVIFKQSGICYFIGDGFNDSGTGSTISNIQFIPSDVGCNSSKSVILYPAGIIFKTDKGIYELNRGVQTSYFGMAVEAYNSQNITASLIVPSRNQIRFLTSSGFSLLYDYVMGQWSVFTNHTGYSSANWQGNYVYARIDGSIYEENSTSFLDNASSYSLVLQTGWMPISSVQNFQRVKKIIQLGDYQNGASASHGVQIAAAYDFGPTFLAAVPYLFDSASGSGVFQYQESFARQKCDTISLLISEVVTGASGESMDLTNMSFVAGVKKGVNKLSPGRSVG